MIRIATILFLARRLHALASLPGVGGLFLGAFFWAKHQAARAQMEAMQ